MKILPIVRFVEVRQAIASCSASILLIESNRNRAKTILKESVAHRTRPRWHRFILSVILKVACWRFSRERDRGGSLALSYLLGCPRRQRISGASIGNRLFSFGQKVANLGGTGPFAAEVCHQINRSSIVTVAVG